MFFRFKKGVVNINHIVKILSAATTHDTQFGDFIITLSNNNTMAITNDEYIEFLKGFKNDNPR